MNNSVIKTSILFLFLSFSMCYPVHADTSSSKPATSTAEKNTRNDNDIVFERRIKRDAGQVYAQLFSALENNGYFVVSETNIGKNLALFAQRWGDDYNKNKLKTIRSLVFCNGWYANQLSNYDPKMLALCPMHVTVIHKDGITSVLYLRPGQVAKDSPARKVAEELEQDVIRIINNLPA